MFLQASSTEPTNRIKEDLILLSALSTKFGKRYKVLKHLGYRYCITSKDGGSNYQNNGIVATFNTSSFATTRDINQIDGEVDHYDSLEDICELNYLKGRKVVVLKCVWAYAYKKDA